MCKSWTTLLSFDFGISRIGVAVGQYITLTANALPVLKAKDGIPIWSELTKLVNDWQPDAFIVGIPFNQRCQQMEKRARKFAQRLSGRFFRPWYEIDESFSTCEIKSRAYKCGHQGDFINKPIDSWVAKLLLESWMNEVKN